MTRIKICGITNVEDATIAIDYGTDAIGFVFAESKRKVSKEKVRDIVHKLPPFVTLVGLFVNETAKNIEDICKYCGLNTIQLHGNEPPDFLRDLKQFKIIKAFRIKNEEDIGQVQNYQADALLLDGYAENQRGGTGTTFDWKIVGKAKTSIPIIIAGGLTHINVSEAIHISKPYGVDVSSGVEMRPGKKDKHLIRKFIDTVKG
ncbi:MAG: phosphoribosylanthranilate isomerase [Candidatus Scalindua sp. AMX11]|nr:MAG: phosphoribosylanthranilate isomerase [Candidatus Scalindua sp.]NOG82286.1 phosphoribosylanthranilate isomerase [Planctomycetota bacterium]RZV65912.1 MAG: phosphoribosylanthranilate isomerase [Candidatus Scalindua sp. SCAELEC01]TDE63571.1 MAG: phosphoribosylanthranilate isomerase [Candidatus Scalindua sp. AMX11]GJQ60020.1 MAG: N-(5'-phosphoribosyl)anthranilate isomerase [Candidatus Scalindua sp.]